MLLIFVVVTLLVYWIALENNKKNQINTKLKNFPGTNSDYPILGNIHVWSITKWSIHEKIKHFIKVMRGYHTTVKIWFGTKLVIVVNNPDDIKTILSSPHCVNKSSIYHTVMGGESVLIASGNKWRNQRRHLNSAFSPRVLSSYANEFNQFGRDVVEAVKEHATSEKEFDITPTLGVHATHLMTRTIYGIQHKLESSKHCYELVERLMTFWGERMLELYLNFFKILLLKIFRVQPEDKIMNRELRILMQPLFQQKIKDYQKNRKTDDGKESSRAKLIAKDEDFLEKLTRLQFEGIITPTEHRHTSMTMYFAGTETTARSISMVILMLAIYQEYQHKIYEEIRKFIELHGDGEIDISKLNDLNLLDRFSKETLRLYPIVPIFGRTPTRDIAIKDGVIPAGTDILISVTNLHQDPNIWGEDAMKFNPDNFLPHTIANRNACSYLPFSYGPRNCLGFKFGQISAYMAIINLMRHYQFKTSLKVEDLKFQYGVTAYLTNDNLVSLHSRNDKK